MPEPIGENEYVIVYAGTHIDTLLLLYEEKSFNVVAVSLIEAFPLERTLNPANILFKCIYRLRKRNRFTFLERLLLNLWVVCNNLATSHYFKYRNYLTAISKNKTSILDFSRKDEVLQFIKYNNVDLLVVNTWGLLPDEIIFAPKFKSVNIHPSKLPQYRGALPTLWALRNRDRESAVTYIVLDGKVDAGYIIGQYLFEISSIDDCLTLEVKIDKIIATTLLHDLKGYLSGTIIPIEQDGNSLSVTGRYYDYMAINWHHEDGREIFNKINLYPLLEPFVYCHTDFSGRQILIKKANFIETTAADESELGRFFVQRFKLFIRVKNGVIVTRLFLDLSSRDSLMFFLKRHGALN